MKFILKSRGYYYAKYNSFLSDKLGKGYGFEAKSHGEKTIEKNALTKQFYKA